MDLKQLCLTSFFFFFLYQRNCRYDGQIAVFGSKLQELLGKQRYFLVSGPTHSSLSIFWTCVGLSGVFFSDEYDKFMFNKMSTIPGWGRCHRL